MRHLAAFILVVTLASMARDFIGVWRGAMRNTNTRSRGDEG